MADGAVDPFEFDEEEYQPNPGTVDFSESFCQDLFGSDSESETEFYGFTREEVYLAPGSRVRAFYERTEEVVEKENAGTPVKRAKKTRRDPSRWKRNIKKRELNSGKRTKIERSGRIRYERETGPDCGCARLECFSKIDLETRGRILSQFNKMGEYNLQNVYLRGLIERQPVKKRGNRGCDGRAEDGKGNAKNCTYQYYVQTPALQCVQVCLQAFLSIYGIGEKRLRVLRSKESECLTDMRGKHENRGNIISEEIKQKVRNHILSFPRQASHYSRKDNENKRYLREDLSVNRMHQLYLQTHEPEVWDRQQHILRSMQQNDSTLREKPKPEVCYRLYYDIFTTEFNLGFGLPRTDTCSRCDELSLAIKQADNDEDKCSLKLQRREHQRNAEGGYESKKADKRAAKRSWEGKSREVGGQLQLRSKDAVDMLTFDFQQNLPTPNLTHQDMFYARQLWTYNFGVHDCLANKGYMFMWPETTAKKGSSEVVSCLDTFLTKYNTGARSLVTYSDGCGGQNKNHTLIGYLYDIHARGIYEVLDHKFLVRGHTFLENDTDFSQIEKRKKSAEVFLPEDWMKIVKVTNLRKPFEVTEMTQRNFLDWKGHLDQKYRLEKKDVSGNPWRLRDVHWLNFGWGEEIDKATGETVLQYHPGEVWMKKSLFREEPWVKVKMRVKLSHTVKPAQLYCDEIRLKAGKVRDLKAMAEKYIPAPQKDYYLMLQASDGEESDE